MKVFYGTITDINYLVRALCLYRSFSAFLDGKVYGVYCLDDSSVRILEGLARPRRVLTQTMRFFLGLNNLALT